MKKKIYYLSFTLLGAMFGFLTHAIVEIWYIKLLLADFSKYGLGMDWWTWERMHFFGVAVLVLGFGWVGYMQGVKWWKFLYVDQGARKFLHKKLKKEF